MNYTTTDVLKYRSELRAGGSSRRLRSRRAGWLGLKKAPPTSEYLEGGFLALR